MSVRRAPCSLRDATLIILGLPCVPRALPCSATLCCGLARYTLRSLSRLAAMAEVWEHGGVLCFQTFLPCKNRFLKSDNEGQLRKEFHTKPRFPRQVGRRHCRIALFW